MFQYLTAIPRELSIYPEISPGGVVWAVVEIYPTVACIAFPDNRCIDALRLNYTNTTILPV